MATLQELETALKNADAAGDMDAARKLAAVVARARNNVVDRIPDMPVGETEQRAPDPTIGEQAVGAGEAGLALATGATGGTVGMIGGTLKGLAKQILSGQFGTLQGQQLVQEAAAKGAQALTYAPRTEAGQDITQTVGGALEQTIPLAGLTAELGAISAGINAAKPAAMATARRVAEPVQSAATKSVETIKQAAPSFSPKSPDTATGAQSVGAAATPMEIVRTQTAESLPVPIKLTKGAATRDAEQLAFEKEQMKNPELGAPLRARTEENNLQALQNFDALIDMTEAQAPDFASTGNRVISALSNGHRAAKTAVRVAYKEAENAGEMEAPVKLDNIASFLKETAPEAEVAPILKVAKQKGVALGILSEGPDGELIANAAPLKTVELFRRSIGEAAGIDPTNRLFSGRMREAIDETTEGLGGSLYAKARSLRRQQAMKYENRAIVARLINNRKGMDDPQVAVDQVFNKSILNGSPEEITFLKRVLNTSGEDGQQAWKELQGATLKHLRDESSKGMGMDSSDNPVISPAKLHNSVSALDKNNRLDIVLGKKNAAIVRDLNDVVRYVNTVPPGTLINNSGTAGTLLAAMAEAGTTGALTGLPVPIISALRALSVHIRNNRIKAKIDKALNIKPK